MAHDHHHDHSACIALAWFTETEWQKLKGVADDQLDESYERWLAGAKKLERQLHDQGQHAHRISLEVDTLVRWCTARKRPLNSEARSAYAAALAARGF